MHGFYRISLHTPEVAIANPPANVRRIVDIVAQSNDRSILVFPELCISGYSCGDLFAQADLIDSCKTELVKLVKDTSSSKSIVIVGLPLLITGRLYNIAAVMQSGKILGLVPKTHLPNYREFYEARWFVSASTMSTKTTYLNSEHHDVPCGTDLIFELDDRHCFAVEICEDLWSPDPPSTRLAAAGASLIINLSASNELLGKADFRRKLVELQSMRLRCVYAYCSAGPSESTSDLIFSGHSIVAEDGKIINQTQNLDESFIASELVADVDLFRVDQLRRHESVYGTLPAYHARRVRSAHINSDESESLLRMVDPSPFVPADPHERKLRCEEALDLQVSSLVRRMQSIGPDPAAIFGVSGGLDSALVALVLFETAKRFAKHAKKLRCFAVSMPGFGTSDTTRKSAQNLGQALGFDFFEIDIQAACKQHFADIGHDPKSADLVFENTQARERTQILMDLSNKHRAIVLGTGDLSEIALGWNTFNGDHMSMYNVNCGVAKTLVSAIVEWYAEYRADSDLQKVLRTVIATPISPELLPTKEGKTTQLTETVLGPYELHDFFLYHFVRYGASCKRVEFLALQAFADKYAASYIRDCLVTFLRRFFANQFKRNPSPDGPKIGTISLSPRGDWRMPSEAEVQVFLAEISDNLLK